MEEPSSSSSSDSNSSLFRILLSTIQDARPTRKRIRSRSSRRSCWTGETFTVIDADSDSEGLLLLADASELDAELLSDATERFPPPRRQRPRLLLALDESSSSEEDTDMFLLPDPEATARPARYLSAPSPPHAHTASRSRQRHVPVPPQVPAQLRTRPLRRRTLRAVPVLSKRMLRRGSLKSVAKALCSRCCPWGCMRTFSPYQVLEARTAFLSKVHSSASEWICQQMGTFWDPATKKWTCLVLGIEVCVNAFCLFHGITHSKWFSVRTSFLAGRQVFLHAHTASDKSSPKADLMAKWMNDFILANGDTLTNSEIHLPMGFRKVDLHGIMVKELMEANPLLTDNDMPGELLFRQTWKKRYGYG